MIGSRASAVCNGMVTSGLLMAHNYTDMRPSGRLDPDEIKRAKVDRATLRRAWGFARAYRRNFEGSGPEGRGRRECGEHAHAFVLRSRP